MSEERKVPVQKQVRELLLEARDLVRFKIQKREDSQSELLFGSAPTSQSNARQMTANNARELGKLEQIEKQLQLLIEQL